MGAHRRSRRGEDRSGSQLLRTNANCSCKRQACRGTWRPGRSGRACAGARRHGRRSAAAPRAGRPVRQARQERKGNSREGGLSTRRVREAPPAARGVSRGGPSTRPAREARPAAREGVLARRALSTIAISPLLIFVCSDSIASSIESLKPSKAPRGEPAHTCTGQASERTIACPAERGEESPHGLAYLADCRQPTPGPLS